MVIFDRDGNYLSSWGNGSFEFAHGIHIADDIVYVTDRNSSVCIMYTLDGKPIQMLGRHGVHSDPGCEVPAQLWPSAARPPAPGGGRRPPASLAAGTGAAPGFEEALDVLADRLDHWLGVGDFAAVRAAWLARASHLGQRIEARLPHQTLSGILEDVDAEGALVLRTPNGTRRITAADIHFPE